MQEGTTKKLLLGAGMAAIGGLTTLFADFLIRRYFPERIILKDLFFIIIPNFPWLSMVADGIIAFTFVLTFLWISERKLPRLAEFAFAFGLMLFFRGILNVVTPIGDPSGDLTKYGFLEAKPLMGMFPSGHIAALNLEYWLIRHWKSGKMWEYFFLVLIVIEALALLSTRGHYSIDIAGGIALGYLVVKITKKYL